MGAPRMVPMILGQSETTTIAEQAAPDLYLVAVCDVLGFSDLFTGSSDLIKTQKLRAVYEKRSTPESVTDPVKMRAPK